MVPRRKTPVLSRNEMRRLLNSIDTGELIGLRYRALLGLMVDTFARVSAVFTGGQSASLRKSPFQTLPQRPDYHIGRAEEHLRLLREGDQLQDHLSHAATRLLMADLARARPLKGSGGSAGEGRPGGKCDAILRKGE